MSAQTKPWQVDAQERSHRAKSLLVSAALWAPSTAERDIILDPLAELLDPDETAPARLGWQRPQTPAFADAASSAALRNGTDGATAAVVSTKHKVASAPRHKQTPTSHYSTVTTLHCWPFFSLDPLMAGWASLLHCRAHAAFRTAT